MKLSERAIEAINNHSGRVALMAALGFREGWIVKLIRDNKENGPLTTAAALGAISQATGLKPEEVLESTKELANEKVA